MQNEVGVQLVANLSFPAHLLSFLCKYIVLLYICSCGVREIARSRA
jgi:hypothetical protein